MMDDLLLPIREAYILKTSVVNDYRGTISTSLNNREHMNRIATEYDDDTGIVTFTLVGRVSADDLVAAADGHFAQWPESLPIWDLTLADVSEFGLPDLERISRRSSEVRGSSVDPRSAVVVDDSTKRLLLKLYDAVQTTGASAVRFRSFETVDDARSWLLSGSAEHQTGSIAC